MLKWLSKWKVYFFIMSMTDLMRWEHTTDGVIDWFYTIIAIIAGLFAQSIYDEVIECLTKN